jgi:hypothetical protein
LLDGGDIGASFPISDSVPAGKKNASIIGADGQRMSFFAVLLVLEVGTARDGI